MFEDHGPIVGTILLMSPLILVGVGLTGAFWISTLPEKSRIRIAKPVRMIWVIAEFDALDMVTGEKEYGVRSQIQIASNVLIPTLSIALRDAISKHLKRPPNTFRAVSNARIIKFLGTEVVT